ncbi:LLM class F420-dependent oxidoreductase [Streptomyces sp. B1866]|uniref:LLM class F420-dependent oxidoreductase n=1 Tax=Streptomyces sp. B1866 TaxID=3075431 RepID=UPI00288ECA62|nr:LLM class F420-dependent oxidoreductase [Streptomyces sp. B1866]MDT3398204.1 LLM class F420-dependent oxidoreductase [Streptomyces sp. B1866]
MTAPRAAPDPGRLPRLTVALGLWQDRPAEEALATARLADALGFGELWIGEMATYDAFALATAIGRGTARIPLTVGPLAAAVRDPAMIAMGAASVAQLTGRGVGVAVGASSPVVVSRWHGRDHRRPAVALAESAAALRAFLETGTADVAGEVVRTRGFRLRLPVPGPRLTVAAFGPAALAVAARHADRLALALVSAAAAGETAARAATLAAAAGRPRPEAAVWVPVAVTRGPGTTPGQERAAVEQVRRMLVAYLAAPGYAEMFARAGHGEVVAYARRTPHPRELLRAVPRELVEHVAVFGDAEAVRRRLAAYGAAVDEVAVLPCATPEDPAGAHTLRTVAALARQDVP